LETEEEKALMRDQRRIHMVNERTEHLRLKRLFRRISPNLLQLYPSLNGASRVNVRVLVDGIATDASLKNSFYQSLLNSGFKQEQSRRVLAELCRLSFNFEHLNEKTQKTIRVIMNKSLRSSNLWDADVFDSTRGF
jgi:hypothetical protein